MPSESSKPTDAKHPFLISLGARVLELRRGKGLTRKNLATAARVSERHLANLEYGEGNASVLVLLQIAQALDCPLAALLGDVTTSSPEWLLLRNLLEGQDERTLAAVRSSISSQLGNQSHIEHKANRIALIGLRGAGKSSLGLQLAKTMSYEFIELSESIEKLAGCNASEIQALYGINAYRRYERRALETAIEAHQNAVIATPGGLVSDVGSFSLLLDRCHSVWLKASPEDHMQRVLAQGDTRPIAASREAMQDLKGILAGRTAFYSKADLTLDTSELGFAQTLSGLVEWAQQIRKPIDSEIG
jgi:XRE family transcriptional regulator, aerobic/anaerobic benzoate catabolism transcriptional regulator